MAPSPKGDASPSQVLPLVVGVMSWRPVHKWSPKTLFVSSYSAALSQAISHQLSFTSKVFCCLSSTHAVTLLTPPPKGGAGLSVLSWFVTVLAKHLRSEHIDPRVSRSMRPQSETADMALAPFSHNHHHLSLDFQHTTVKQFWLLTVLWRRDLRVCYNLILFILELYVCVQKNLVDSPHRRLCPLGSPFCTAAWRYWMN